LNFIFSYHPAWIFVALIVAFIYAVLLYFRNDKLFDISKKTQVLLFSLRFLSVFLICLLLIGIIIEKFIKIKEKPLIFVAQDSSQSIVHTKDSTFYYTTYPKQLNEVIKQLEEKFDVIPYSFSTTVSDGISTKYDGEYTDISKVLNQIYSQYSNRNIGAIVLSTDGIYNTGANPLYSISKKSYVPVYTIGLGDTTEQKDVKLLEVFNNDIAFFGNTFPVEVRLSQIDYPNQKVNVTIFDGDKKVDSKTIDFKEKKEQQTLNFNLPANKIGFRKYTVKVSELNDEFTFKNNTANFYIDIIDGRQKIALVYSGVHPDLGVINYVVSNNKNYEIELIKDKDFKEATPYDLIICHNYQNNNSNLHQVLKEGKKPTLFIVGGNANMSDINQLNIGVNGSGNKTEEVNFVPNGKFNSILYPAEVTQLLTKAPPLTVPFGSFSFSKSLDVFAYQKVGNIALDKPLIYFSHKNNTKYGVIMGEGIWRWRLYDQAQNNSTTQFETLISKIITFLAVKENKNPFKVHLKNEYTENEVVTVLAELYNSSYDLINTPEVEFKLTNENDKVFDYHFFKTSNAYKLDLGKLPQGIYKWSAKTVLSNKTYTANGTFLVKEVKLEWLNNTANHRLLRNISENTNGKFYFHNQLTELQKDINTREDIVTVSFNEKSFDDLIDYKWLFFLIVLLLFTEWFSRKWFGI
jgi:hypothetical protein